MCSSDLLEINKTNPADVVNAAGAWTVTGSLILTRGTWNASSFTHLIAGNWNSAAANFTFSAATSTITLTPTATPNITTKGIGTDPFYNLTPNAGGVLQSPVQVNQDLTIAGTLNTNNVAAYPAVALLVGGSITGDNISASHLFNIKRLAYEITTPPPAAFQPPEAPAQPSTVEMEKIVRLVVEEVLKAR